MGPVTMAFITRCCTSALPSRRLLVWLLTCCLGLVGVARAENAELAALRVERADDGLFLTARVDFRLSPVVEDALHKGIAVHFVAEAEVMRERWYWYDQKAASAHRYMRVAYQPLTRRWRLITSSEPLVNAGQCGLRGGDAAGQLQLLTGEGQRLLDLGQHARRIIAGQRVVHRGQRFLLALRLGLPGLDQCEARLERLLMFLGIGLQRLQVDPGLCPVRDAARNVGAQILGGLVLVGAKTDRYHQRQHGNRQRRRKREAAFFGRRRLQGSGERVLRIILRHSFSSR